MSLFNLVINRFPHQNSQRTRQSDYELSSVVLRANPAMKLISFDHLSDEEKSAFEGLERDPELYGLLKPSHASATIKSVDKNTALLLNSLKNASPLPAFFKNNAAVHTKRQISQLILDGILEINAGGRFFTGASAQSLVGIDLPKHLETNLIGKLSLDAIQFASHLPITSAQELAIRLYAFNRIPISESWSEKLRSQADTFDFLKVNCSSKTYSLLEKRWKRVSSSDRAPWMSWEPKKTSHGSTQSGTFKLYISSKPEQIADALRQTVELIPKNLSCLLKVGARVSEILRPDKFILHFNDVEAFKRTAEALHNDLDNFDAHGVPFTADLDRDGLLSWGIDPPIDSMTVRWRERESWRVWVVNQLASSLLEARVSSSEESAWKFALRRIQLEGVDPIAWAPIGSSFSITKNKK